jgi:hypothetical protein
MMSGFFPLGSLQVTTLVVRTSLLENDDEDIDTGVRGNDDIDSETFMFEEYVLSSHATPLGSPVVYLYPGP